MKEVKGYLVCDARKSGGLLAVDTVLQALPGRCLDLDVLQLPGDKGDLVLEGDGFIWDVILIIVLFPLLFCEHLKRVSRFDGTIPFYVALFVSFDP